MADGARVHSLDALKQLREMLVVYGESCQDALGATNLEIRRSQDWIANQQKVWQRRVRELEEEVNKTKNDLMVRKHWSQGGKGPGYTEQEIAFRRAKQRLEEAQEKVENCKKWTRQLPQAITEYRGPAGQLGGMVATHLKHSIVILDRRIAALEAYVAITHSDMSESAAPAAAPVVEAAAPTISAE